MSRHLSAIWIITYLQCFYGNHVKCFSYLSERDIQYVVINKLYLKIYCAAIRKMQK